MGGDIYNNTVLRNNEQGIWIVKAKNGEIHNNVVRENRHRKDEAGGSSGIRFEGGISNFKVFDNEVGYNDMFGIELIFSSDNEIYRNEIHHNGDGGIGFCELFYREKKSTGNTMIKDNSFHHNRMAAILVQTNLLGKVIVDNNVFTQN